MQGIAVSNAVPLQAFYLQQQATQVCNAKEHSPSSLKLQYYPNAAERSEGKALRLQEGQKQGEKYELERSGEGSAPNSGGEGGEGSKDGNRKSNSREKPGSGSGNNGNGNSATKQCQGSNQPNNESGMNGNGNSATKAVNPSGRNGNSGNDASTTSKVCIGPQSTCASRSAYNISLGDHLVPLLSASIWDAAVQVSQCRRRACTQCSLLLVP